MEGSGRDSRTATKPKLMPQYLIYVKGLTLDEATEEVLHLAYLFLIRALREHKAQGRNGEFEAFAIELLALLQRSRQAYTTATSEPPSPP
jgi:hypothetical protein